jgi:site-specific recombinase XerD
MYKINFLNYIFIGVSEGCFYTMFKPGLKPEINMNAKVNVLCYKSKTLSNGENPLMIRVCKDRKTKYQSLGISVNPKFWDFEKQRPKSNCPNRELILQIILAKEAEYQTGILELNANKRAYTASTLITATTQKYVAKTVEEFYTELINRFKQEEREGNAAVYKYSYTSLKRFNKGNLNILFADIDVTFLNKYEQWLRSNGDKDTSISVKFRTLRSVYNKAIEEKCALKSTYPFDGYKISKFDLSTAKRAIPKDTVKQIINADTSTSNRFYAQFSRDIFTFSYLCGGINFADIARLTGSNIIGGTLTYIRQKTGKKITLPLSDEAMLIIQRYRTESNSYIFPILNEAIHKTESQKYNRSKKVRAKVNKYLKIIAKSAQINANLTTYVARHSFATILKNSGVNVALISEVLGHADLATTQIYLDSFESEQVGEAMKNLL